MSNCCPYYAWYCKNRRSIIIYTPLSPAITCQAVHCQLSNIPLHCTQLLATCPACPSVVLAQFASPRGFRPICRLPVSVQFVHLLPFIVVTVPGVHHLAFTDPVQLPRVWDYISNPFDFLQSSTHSLSCPSVIFQRCSLPPPFLHYPCSFLILIFLLFLPL